MAGEKASIHRALIAGTNWWRNVFCFLRLCHSVDGRLSKDSTGRRRTWNRTRSVLDNGPGRHVDAAMLVFIIVDCGECVLAFVVAPSVDFSRI